MPPELFYFIQYENMAILVDNSTETIRTAALNRKHSTELATAYMKPPFLHTPTSICTEIPAVPDLEIDRREYKNISLFCNFALLTVLLELPEYNQSRESVMGTTTYATFEIGIFFVDAAAYYPCL